MKKYLMLLIMGCLATGVLHASNQKQVDPQYEDRDFDGVIDRDDRCPNTPFFAIVNKKGCMVERIKITKEQEESVKEILSQRR